MGRRDKRWRGALHCALLGGVTLAGAAHADELSDLKQRIEQLEQRQPQPPSQTPAPTTTGDALTWRGVTLYGQVDLGVTYQSHATPLNQNYGLEYFVAKNSQGARVSAAPNALSASNIGLKGDINLMPGWNAVFKLESVFLPTSGQLVDPLKAVAQNNGVPLNQQTSNGDSSRAGQLFSNAAYVGLSSGKWGTATFGRQNSLGLDGIAAYDPQGGAPAFSLVGYQGATAGGGVTESARLDSALKYRVAVGPVRVGALYQFGGSGNVPRGAWQFNLGSDIGKLSVDAVYSKVYDAIAASTLSAAQTAVLPTNSLAGTISDNTAWMLMGKYNLGAVQLYAAGSRMEFANPSNPLSAGATAQGGYLLSAVTNNAFNNHKVLTVYWAGAKWQATPKLSVTGAYYHENQNSFSGTGCNDTTLASCGGREDAFSVVGLYKFSDHWEGYAGAMVSHVAGGVASGFLHTSSVDPTIGARLRF
jgi:predicted porin